MMASWIYYHIAISLQQCLWTRKTERNRGAEKETKREKHENREDEVDLTPLGQGSTKSFQRLCGGWFIKSCY